MDGGTTAITKLDPLGCYPAIAEDYAAEPGYRMHGPSGIQLFSNLDTDAVFLVQADTSFTGSMTFDTLASSSYGQHHYVAKIGSVTKDGVPFVIDWNAPDAAFEELYAGLITTFAPDEVPATSCLAAGVCLENADRSVFGVRQPLHIYMTFVAGTSQPDQFYTVQTAAEATCLTPMSIDEQFAYAPIEPPEYSGIGTLTLADGNGNAYLNPSSANSALCSNGILGTKTDTGQTLSWADGRVVFTYDVEQGSLDYALGTKLATGPGYKGYLWADTADGNHEYDAALGSFTYDGANLDLLAGGDEAITGFANAIRATYFDDGTASTNCITDGTCILTADAQSGQTTLAMGISGLAFVFSTANHELLEIDETTRN